MRWGVWRRLVHRRLGNLMRLAIALLRHGARLADWLSRFLLWRGVVLRRIRSRNIVNLPILLRWHAGLL
jgi:hypothetical protein